MVSRIRRSIAIAAAAAVGVVATLAGVPTAPAGASANTYVALGDSYTAGPLIPVQEEPWGCLRSTNNYPKKLAERLGLTLRDASCSGARTDDMAGPQEVLPEPNPPQLDRLDPQVGLVTLQIGGNDIGFAGIVETCAEAGLQGRSCRSVYVDEVTGADELRRRIKATAPKIAGVIDVIHSRAPKAKVLVLGYPGIFRIGAAVPASCPEMVVREADAQYLRGVHEALNTMIEATAEANDATYVDVYEPSAGRTACDVPAFRWVEPIVPLHAAAPVHPNLNGMLGVSDVLLEAVRPNGDDTDLELPPGVPTPPPVPSPL